MYNNTKDRPPRPTFKPGTKLLTIPEELPPKHYPPTAIFVENYTEDTGIIVKWDSPDWDGVNNCWYYHWRFMTLPEQLLFNV